MVQHQIKNDLRSGHDVFHSALT